MSAIRFEEVKLDTGHGDDHAVLVIRDGRLTAILSRLSDLHEELAGSWFVEISFADEVASGRRVFRSPAEFVTWAGWRAMLSEDGAGTP